MVDIADGASPDDDSPKVLLARGLLRNTRAICGGDLDAIGRKASPRLCAECRARAERALVS